MNTVLAQEQVGNTGLNLAIFAGFVAITMVFVLRASRTNKSAADMYTAGSAFTGRQNGIAISGDYLSAASFLGIAGAIALTGYDGFLYSVGFLVAWVVALLLVAELLRNTGRFTMADVLAFRMRERPVRTAAATSTLVVSFFYLLAQMAGAGGLVALLMNITGRVGQSMVDRRGRRADDRLRADRRHEGHDLRADHQGDPADRRRRGHDGVGARASTASTSPTCSVRVRRRARPLEPGVKYGVSEPDQARLHLARPGAGAGHRGPAAHPDALLHRADGQGGPQVGGVGDLADRPVLPVHAGARLRCGGAGRAGDHRRRPRRGEFGRAAARLRARRDGAAGRHLRGRVRDDPRGGRRVDDHRVCVVRARHLCQRDQARAMRPPEAEVRVARISAVVVGIVAIIGGIAANGQNIAFLVALAFAVAASANLPTILYSLFWKRFNTRGCLWSIYGGLIITVTLIVFSPAVSGAKTSMFPDVRTSHGSRWPTRVWFRSRRRSCSATSARSPARSTWSTRPPRWRSARSPARARRARRSSTSFATVLTGTRVCRQSLQTREEYP